MPEYLDILDEKGNPTGQSRTYDDVHKEGLIHHTVHVWFFNSKRELLIQKRAAKRRAYSNLFDISVAGHISSGQSSIEAVQRETEEELGLSLPASSFLYLFTIQGHDILNNGTHIDNEFQDVYLVRSDVNINELKLSSEEVAEVKWVSVEEFETLTNDHKELITPHAEEYRKLLQFLKNN